MITNYILIALANTTKHYSNTLTVLLTKCEETHKLLHVANKVFAHKETLRNKYKCSYHSPCPVDIGLLALRTDTLFTPAPERDRSFYLLNVSNQLKSTLGTTYYFKTTYMLDEWEVRSYAEIPSLQLIAVGGIDLAPTNSERKGLKVG